jgi:DNA-binding IclR family transcriptional regulator
MPHDELPKRVYSLLDEFAGSQEELGILLALIDARTRWWDVGSMAASTGLTPSHARRALETFASRNLLDIRISDDVRYRLRPGTPELAHAIDALVGVYRRSPAAVHRWATARADRLRSGTGGRKIPR